ncbi:MAG: 16S rRNA (guanine(966)-N(2))-methyltransferase RsmD [Gammaproteobacteria bacterium]|nr:16S rRNA (guanine(966)-N(2))-methyltransferase RsmD [Gammaproteobacteria bacterium]
MASNEVRIIGGKWKGRKLRFPDSTGLRPTLGRARGSLFNWLVADLQGAHCLDLYAGSGALGLEAVSRGAADVVMVERNRRVAEALKRNMAMLGANAQIVVAPAQRFLRTAVGPWQLIFLDPPFESVELDVALDLIASRDLLAPGGRVYVERRKPASPSLQIPTSGWRTLKHSHAGDSQFGLLARE